MHDLPTASLTFGHNPKVQTRLRNVLGRNGIHTLGQLLEHSEKDLLDLQGFGYICLAELKAKLQSMGLELRQEETW